MNGVPIVRPLKKAQAAVSVFLSCAVPILKWQKQHGQSQFGTDGHITYGKQIDFESDAHPPLPEIEGRGGGTPSESRCVAYRITL